MSVVYVYPKCPAPRPRRQAPSLSPQRNTHPCGLFWGRGASAARWLDCGRCASEVPSSLGLVALSLLVASPPFPSAFPLPKFALAGCPRASGHFFDAILSTCVPSDPCCGPLHPSSSIPTDHEVLWAAPSCQLPARGCPMKIISRHCLSRCLLSARRALRSGSAAP
jgi:hypothetical protein